MKNISIGALVLLFLVLGCTSDDDQPLRDNCIRGQGSTLSESRSLSSFHSINSTIVADVFLTQGSQQNVRIEAQQNILEVLKTEVVNEELILSFEECVEGLEKVTVTITLPEIRRLTLAGVGNFTLQNDFDLTSLEVFLVGVGDFNLRGTTEDLFISLVGVGNVNAFDLNTDNCEVSIVGANNTEVFVNDTLDVTIVGAGTVFYKGEPSITSNITGTGSIVNAN